jgi:prevent-host-death family protein
MAKEFSVYEAKKRLSEILRGVRERRETYVVTYHGEPIAEIRPIEAAGADDVPARWRELEARGLISGGRPPRAGDFRPIAELPGALQRFLEERD